jgi:hypothetical protein
MLVNCHVLLPYIIFVWINMFAFTTEFLLPTHKRNTKTVTTDLWEKLMVWPRWSLLCLLCFHNTPWFCVFLHGFTFLLVCFEILRFFLKSLFFLIFFVPNMVVFYLPVKPSICSIFKFFLNYLQKNWNILFFCNVLQCFLIFLLSFAFQTSWHLVTVFLSCRESPPIW